MLVIFDLDETILHTETEGVTYQVTPDFTLDKIWPVYVRPYFHELINWLNNEGIEIAIWSSGTDSYVRKAIKNAFPEDIKPVLILTRTDCSRVLIDHGMYGNYHRPRKDLTKIEARGYELNQVLMIEDNPNWIDLQPDNVIEVKPYMVEPGDDELGKLKKYLSYIIAKPNWPQANKTYGRKV